MAFDLKNSVFVTGTDTGIGKTYVSILLMRFIKKQGLTVAGFKPVAAGCENVNDHWLNEDALKLQAESSVELPYELVNPYAFEEAIAPHLAAQSHSVDIDLNHIKQCFEQIQSQVDVVIVEGAGGWLVPINKTECMSDIAKSLQLPVALVVGMRLGCINHSLLSSSAILADTLSLQFLVFNQFENEEMTNKFENIQSIQSRVPAQHFMEISFNQTELIS